jgi:hypothetical protein
MRTIVLTTQKGGYLMAVPFVSRRGCRVRGTLDETGSTSLYASDDRRISGMGYAGTTRPFFGPRVVGHRTLFATRACPNEVPTETDAPADAGMDIDPARGDC